MQKEKRIEKWKKMEKRSGWAACFAAKCNIYIHDKREAADAGVEIDVTRTSESDGAGAQEAAEAECVLLEEVRACRIVAVKLRLCAASR